MKNNINYTDSVDIAVIGGGAAGCLAAGLAASKGNSVVLIEKNSKIARKVLISGKGRCNVTNNIDLKGLIDNTPGNGKFLYGAFSKFGAVDVIRFFEELGVTLKTERGNRVFPESDKASDIVDALYKFLKNNNTVILHDEVTDISFGNNKKIMLKSGKSVNSESVIIATGGLSYPQTGSTGDGYKFARKAGHSITSLSPSLVPLIISEGWCKNLQGLSLKNISLSVIDSVTAKTVFKDRGELLFTHFGVSGPLVLSASAHMINMTAGRYRLIIDFKPALSFEQLDNRIINDFNDNINSNYINSLYKLLPRAAIPVIAELSKIPFDLKVHQITKEMRKKLCTLLKGLNITVKDFAPVEYAVITHGGVSVSEINPKTMESKIVKGLYFAGEIIDVDAYTGGFNLQIAWSTGYTAGISAKQETDIRNGEIS